MKVLGTVLYDQGFERAVKDFIVILSSEPRNLLISPSDANVLVLAKLDVNFKLVIDHYYWHLPDGVPSVWILKLKGAKNASRCSGSDFFKEIITQTAAMPINHFLCGGADGVAEQLSEQCKKWGNSQISGTFSPPFEGMTTEEIIILGAKISDSKTNVVWVGLGAPKQLYFSYKLAQFTKVQAILPIGAAFDFHTNRVKKAPRWIQKIGLEWLFRLKEEPRRLYKRYLKVVPVFIYYNFLDLTSFYFRKMVSKRSHKN